MQITEKKDSLVFDGIHKYFVPALYLKYAYYKICYIFGISYNEAISLWHSNPKSKLIKITERKLTKDELEGRHFLLSSNSRKTQSAKCKHKGCTNNSVEINDFCSIHQEDVYI